MAVRGRAGIVEGAQRGRHPDMKGTFFLLIHQTNTLTQKTESLFHSVSFHAPYFENEWAKSK
jgi:hypothetical protein